QKLRADRIDKDLETPAVDNLVAGPRPLVEVEVVRESRAPSPLHSDTQPLTCLAFLRHDLVDLLLRLFRDRHHCLVPFSLFAFRFFPPRLIAPGEKGRTARS